MSHTSNIGFLLASLWTSSYGGGTFVDFCLSCVVHQQSLLADEQLASCPVLLLGNKIDIPGAASEDYIRQYFGIYGLTTGKVQD